MSLSLGTQGGREAFSSDVNLGWEALGPCGPRHLRSYHSQYRLAPIPGARHDFACAGLVFVCILLVHVLVMPRSV